MPARGVERWLSQRLSHRLGRGDGRTTASAPGSSSARRGAWSPRSPGTSRGGDHDPWAPDALVWPLLGVVDASAGEDVVPHARRAPRPRADRRGGRAAARPPLRGRPAAGAAVRVVRRAAAAPPGRLGGGRRHATAPVRAARPRPALAARALAPAGGARSARPARSCATPACSTRCAPRPQAARPAGAVLAVRAHPDRGHRGRAARGARRAPRRAPVAAAPLRRAVAAR